MGRPVEPVLHGWSLELINHLISRTIQEASVVLQQVSGMNWWSLEDDVLDVHGKCAGRLRHWQPSDSTNLLCLNQYWLGQHKVTAGHTDLQGWLLNSQNKCPPSWDFALCPNLKQTGIGEMKLGRQTNVKKNQYQSHKVFSLGKQGRFCVTPDHTV